MSAAVTQISHFQSHEKHLMSFDDIPPELVWIILSYLDPTTIGQFSLTSKRHFELSLAKLRYTTPPVLQTFLQKLFGAEFTRDPGCEVRFLANFQSEPNTELAIANITRFKIPDSPTDDEELNPEKTENQKIRSNSYLKATFALMQSAKKHKAEDIKWMIDNKLASDRFDDNTWLNFQLSKMGLSLIMCPYHGVMKFFKSF